MAPKKEDLVTKQTCMELLDWLEANGAGEIEQAEFNLFRAIAEGAADEPGCKLPHSQFRNYSRQYRPIMGRWAWTHLHRQCSLLSTRILQPASKRMGLKKYVRATFKEERGGYFQLEYRNRPQLDEMLKYIDDTGMSDKQWLHLVAESVANRYTPKLHIHTESATSTATVDAKRPSSEDIVQLRKGRSEEQDITDRKGQYELVQSKPPIVGQIWRITCMDCMIEKTTDEGKPASRHLIGLYRDCCRKVAEDHGGYCYSDIDGRISFFFGFEPVNDQHASACVKAATVIMQEVGQADSLESKTPTLRILVDTCDAMISFTKDKPAVDFINSRKTVEDMEKYSSANTITVSPATHMRTAHNLETMALGENTENSSPIGYRVLHELDRPAAFSPVLGQATPLVGRQIELTKLLDIYKKAENGSPQIVHVHGIPGIGKSLLIDKLTLHVTSQKLPAFVLTCQCWKCYSHTSYYPISKMLMHYSKPRLGDVNDRCTNRRRNLFQELELADDESISALETLIDPDRNIVSQDPADSVPSCDTAYHCAKADESAKQIPLAVEQILLGLAKHQPVVLLIEDAQWADKSTVQTIEDILQNIMDHESLRIMVVITYRKHSPFDTSALKTKINDVPLSPLTEPATRELAQRVALCLDKKITASELDDIVRRSSGIPVIVWETVASELHAPRWFSTVLFETEDPNGEQNLLNRKTIAQIASMFGYRVNCDTLKDVVFHLSGIADNVESNGFFESALTELCKTGLLSHEQRAKSSILHFAFPSVRNQLYRSISAQDRMENHVRIAEYFRRLSKNDMTGVSETIARHYLLACRHAKDDTQRRRIRPEAVKWWKITGQAALHKLGMPEAISSLQRCLKLAQRLDKNVTNQKMRVQIHFDLAVAFQHQYGVSSKKVKQLYQQAKTFAKQVDEPSLLFRMQWAGWFSTYLKADLNKAKELADQLMRTDAYKESRMCRLEAQHAMWDTLFHMGHLRTATTFHAQGLNAFRKMSFEERSGGYAGHAASSCCLSRCAMVFWSMGLIDEAMLMSDDAITEAKHIGHPNSQVHAYCHAAILGLLCKEPDYVQANAQKGLAYAEEYKLEPRRVLCEILLNAGELLVRPEKSLVSNLTKNLTKWKKIGFRLFDTLWLACIAEALLKICEPQEGLDVIEQAYSVACELGECFYLPEIYRLKAQLLMAKSKRNRKAAKQALYKAVELARESAAQTLMLRALISLNQLLRDCRSPLQEKRQAYQLLKDCFGGYHEGLDTIDLKTARNLIEETDSLAQ